MFVSEDDFSSAPFPPRSSSPSRLSRAVCPAKDKGKGKVKFVSEIVGAKDTVVQASTDGDKVALEVEILFENKSETTTVPSNYAGDQAAESEGSSHAHV